MMCIQTNDFLIAPVNNRVFFSDRPMVIAGCVDLTAEEYQIVWQGNLREYNNELDQRPHEVSISEKPEKLTRSLSFPVCLSRKIKIQARRFFIFGVIRK